MRMPSPSEIKPLIVETPVPMNETQRVLKEALRLLGPNGENWQKNDRGDGAGPYCALGAIGAVALRHTRFDSWMCHHPAVQALYVAAERTLPERSGGAAVAHVNNEAASFSEVRAMFELAITLAA